MINYINIFLLIVFPYVSINFFMTELRLQLYHLQVVQFDLKNYHYAFELVFILMIKMMI